jgi:DNA-binding NtrC family response regulator
VDWLKGAARTTTGDRLALTSSKLAAILVIGEIEQDTRAIAHSLASDYHIGAAPNIMDAAKRLKQETFNVIFFDLHHSVEDLIGILQTLRNLSPGTPVVVTGDVQDTQIVVKAIKAGAFDFISKPYTEEQIQLTVQQALEHRSMKNEIDYLRREQDVIYDTSRIIAVSPCMKKVMATIRKLSQVDSTILVTGETGTGKSFISGHIHFNSPRRSKPFIKVNCANIPETLLESELFGHEKGSFTGADKTRTGRFEQADGGSLFLDELCELPSSLQSKLLRALEDKSFERLGGNTTIRSDTRIIAATNRDIEELVRNAEFREDLYYRINVLRIHIPPLRERGECIEPLAYYLLEKLSRAVKKRIEGFSSEVIRLFQEYTWPGNIRQFANTIERAILVTEGSVITPEEILLPELGSPGKEPPRPFALRLSPQDERDMIYNALEDNLWVQKDAARKLGLTPRALNYRIKKLGITHARWRKNK